MATPPLPNSKLPSVGVSIFTEMSALARQAGAINLSQGFPDFPVSTELLDLLGYYAQEGHNQYAPMAGLPALRKALTEKFLRTYALKVDAEDEITITAGATEALFSTIAALVNPGDEVIILEPAYDSYAPAVQMQGGVCKYVALNNQNFSPDWSLIEQAFSEKTRLFILNTPHNPSGSVWSARDMQQLEGLLAKHTECWVLSDEVYEHIIFDGLEHQSILRYPNLRERAAAVFSFGKTFHATGWKVGYVVAPSMLTREIRKIHQYLTFSVNTPAQAALATYLKKPHTYQGLEKFYQQKRDYLVQKIAGSAFTPLPSSGTYFQLVAIPKQLPGTDYEVARLLTEKYGVATIPLSPFYHNQYDPRMLRICFAKQEYTLNKASELLKKV